MNTTLIRPAQASDLSRIRKIIHAAKLLLQSRHIDQWQDGYPNDAILQDDIASGKGFVLQTGNAVHGYFALSFEEEEPYKKIEEGSWLSAGPYSVLHRLAFTEPLRGKGAALKVLSFWEEQARQKNYSSLRADTHPQNETVQHLLADHGFTRCGIIYIRKHQKRHAFEKRLD